MRDLQAPATLCNLYCLTRYEQVGGSSPLLGFDLPQQTIPIVTSYHRICYREPAGPRELVEGIKVVSIRTALTEKFGLEYPIVSAPMGSVAGGRLAAAVSNAGALGLVGGGYGDPEWLRAELSTARSETTRPWGVGLITWHATHEIVELALSYEPHAFMLSFGDPGPFVPAIGVGAF